MQISISRSKSLEPNTHTRFSRVDYSSLLTLVNTILNNIWSPNIFNNDYRSEENFLSSSLAVLDFDDGRWTMERARNFCIQHKLAAIIAPTKSHGVAKGNNPACDRFRLIMQWHLPITDLKTYRQNMVRLLVATPADKACKDGARFFYPCLDRGTLISGRGLVVERYVQPMPPRPSQYSSTGVIPSFIRRKLDEAPTGTGNRNAYILDVSIMLAAHGYTHTQVLDQIFRLPMDFQTDMTRKEVENVIERGFRFGSAQRKTYQG